MKRCAIYTRVSTDAGLAQEFTSLDNQRGAAEAYIKSQAHESWRLLKDRYDDGGFSGGSMDRPALLRLLDQVRQHRIDVVVVYKVDRLTRSLADFAKLVELFDQYGVSFVSVTQAFNTTTSMGRLTLNVLLSFAQFEREVTGERIRDKIAASKKRGLWMGGNVPLGYRVEARKIVPLDDEVEQVRMIFRRYLELGSIGRLLVELRDRGVVTKRLIRNGAVVRGGISFMRGSLAYLLRNRFYIGEIVYRGAVYPAEHPAIVDRELFQTVQAKLTDQRVGPPVRGGRSSALLTGKLFDQTGIRFTPTHANKRGVRYRYYISRTLIDGRPGEGGPVTRISASVIERVVIDALRHHGRDGEDCDVVARVDRIEVGAAEITIRLAKGIEPAADDTDTISVPWRRESTRRYREVIASADRTAPARPIRIETRETLIDAIARGHRWLDEILSGQVDGTAAIAARESCSRRQVNSTISLTSLAPDIVEEIVSGRIPHGVAMRDLTDAPLLWTEQRRLIGMT